MRKRWLFWLAVAFVLGALGLWSLRPARDPLAQRSTEPSTLLRLRCPSPHSGCAQTASPLVRAYELLPDGRYAEGRALGSASAGFEGRVPEGTYWIIARIPGFARAMLPIRARGDRVELELPLEPAHELKVDVRTEGDDAELSPLGGATVLVEPVPSADAQSGATALAAPFGAASSEEGQATFSGLPRGPYRVTVQARGYGLYQAEVNAPDVLALLRPASTLLVKVRDARGPVAGAQIHLLGLHAWPPRHVEATSTGEAEIFGLAPGRYALVANTGAQITAAPQFVEVRQESAQVLVQLELGPGRELEVLVEDADGKPIEDAQVTFTPDSPYESAHYVRSTKVGRALVAPLIAAEGALQASAKGYVQRVQRVSGEAGVTLRLDRGGIVEGQVRDPDGNPIAGAVVRIAGTDNHGLPILESGERGCASDSYFAWAEGQAGRLLPAGELGVLVGPVPPIPLLSRAQAPCPTDASTEPSSLTTDARGRFSASGIAPGRIVALAESAEWLPGRSGEATLASGGKAELSITLRRGQPLSGRVLDHREIPVAGAPVRMVGREFERSLLTESDGTFELGAAPDELQISVSDPLRPTRVVLSEHRTKAMAREDVQLVLPAPREDAIFRVKDERGVPVEFVEIRVRGMATDAPLQETRFTDENGEARIEEAVGLRVEWFVSGPGWARIRKSGVLRAEENIELAHGVKAEGRVTHVRGRSPADGASVTLVCGDERFVTRTDDVGHYQFSSVPARSCSVQAAHAELGAAEARVTIHPTEYERAFELPDLDLAEPEDIRGTVVDKNGQPVLGAVVSLEPLGPYLPPNESQWPILHAKSDADGAFTLRGSLGEERRIYAALPGASYGEAEVSEEPSVRRELQIELSYDDSAPPDASGTVLIGLEPRGAQVRVWGVARARQSDPDVLRRGDLLLEIGGTRVQGALDARSLLSGPVGSQVALQVRRGGKTILVQARREMFLRLAPP